MDNKQNKKIVAISLMISFLLLAAVITTVLLKDKNDQTKIVVNQKSAELFKGIQQKNMTIGEPSAPLTMIEYFDPQCPYCRDFSNKILPDIITNYVKTGKLKIIFKPLAFLDNQFQTTDSRETVSAIVEADKQGYGPQFTEIFMLNQKREGSKFVNEQFIKKIASQIKDLNAEKVAKASVNYRRSGTYIGQNTESFIKNNLGGTPGFLIGKTEQTAKPFILTELSYNVFKKELDKQLSN